MRSITIDRETVVTHMLDLFTDGQPAILLYGPPGTGKTHLVHEFATKAKLPVYAYTCHPDASVAEIFAGPGADHTKAHPITWVPGPALMSWGHVEKIKPGILLMDDAHLLGIGGEASLYRACDTAPGAVFLHPNGTPLTPKMGKSVTIITMNGEPDILPEPVHDRTAGAQILVSSPSAEMLAELDEPWRALCANDYKAAITVPMLSYRQWRAISKGARRGTNMLDTILMATSNTELTESVLEMVADLHAPSREAIAELIARKR